MPPEDVQVLIEPVEDAALAGEGVREMMVRHPQFVELPPAVLRS